MYYNYYELICHLQQSKENDSVEEFEDALSHPSVNAIQGKNLNKQKEKRDEQKPSQQQDPKGPLCEFCSKRLLAPDAKVCNNCGKHQRGTRSQHQGTLASGQSQTRSGYPGPPPTGNVYGSDPLSQVSQKQ